MLSPCTVDLDLFTGCVCRAIEGLRRCTPAWPTDQPQLSLRDPRFASLASYVRHSFVFLDDRHLHGISWGGGAKGT